MRDPERIDEVLAKIEKIWKRSPDLRLMQLLLNCFKSDESMNRIYNMEEQELVDRLEELYGD